MSNWKKVAYICLFTKKSFYDRNVGFTKLIKALKLR